FFFQAEDGIRDGHVTGVQTCALPISLHGTANISVGTVAADSATISGIIDGGGSLVKQAPGTLVLSNASNSYNGTTTVSAGTLIEIGRASCRERGQTSGIDAARRPEEP